jgi:hypothetical protein
VHQSVENALHAPAEDAFNKRRPLLLVMSQGMLAAATCARAQAAAAPLFRVAVSTPGGPAADDRLMQPLYDEMRRAGWVDKRTASYDRVYANDRMESLSSRRPNRRPASPT